MPDTPSANHTVGTYLAARLVQLGVHHVFGLPGDFNLKLLDHMLEAEGLRWVGSGNELNGSYAADGYARVGRTPGAIVTTFGVGELSAINGIAGSYAEDVPVVHIVGMPSSAAMQKAAPLHHTFLDGDFHRFARMFGEVTAAQTVLTAETAAAEIDRVLTVAITLSKPVYIGVPLDVVEVPVEEARLQRPLLDRPTEMGPLAAFERALRQHLSMADAEEIVVLAGPGVHRRGLETQMRTLADLPGVAIASQIGSKAIIDESHPASVGTYVGATTRDDHTRRIVDDAKTLVMVGSVMSDFTTGFFSHLYRPEDAVELAIDHARIGHAVFPGVRIVEAVRVLTAVVSGLREGVQRDVISGKKAVQPGGTEIVADDGKLTHEVFWKRFEEWLQPSTTLVAEAGTAFYGAIDLTLPDSSDLLGSTVWSSIGYTIPATLGAALARPDRRPVLVIGDGSAQLTAQELGTLFAEGVDPVVFLLNNDGFTIERLIQSPEADYQDVVSWNWTALPAAMGATEVHTRRVIDVAGLREALDVASNTGGRGMLIEVMLDRLDAPRLLLELVRGISSSNAKAH